jgi:hypothetical protein
MTTGRPRTTGPAPNSAHGPTRHVRGAGAPEGTGPPLRRTVCPMVQALPRAGFLGVAQGSRRQRSDVRAWGTPGRPTNAEIGVDR